MKLKIVRLIRMEIARLRILNYEALLNDKKLGTSDGYFKRVIARLLEKERQLFNELTKS